jgi:hypothetical protein
MSKQNIVVPIDFMSEDDITAFKNKTDDELVAYFSSLGLTPLMKVALIGCLPLERQRTVRNRLSHGLVVEMQEAFNKFREDHEESERKRSVTAIASPVLPVLVSGRTLGPMVVAGAPIGAMVISKDHIIKPMRVAVPTYQFGPHTVPHSFAVMQGDIWYN